MGRRIAISQSNYIPWKGYFDLIRAADVFIIYDEVQYTRQDWRNRNRLRTAQGLRWLTIPVRVDGLHGQTVDQTPVADPSWAERHRRTAWQELARAPFIDDVRDELGRAWHAASGCRMLTDVNEVFMRRLCELLGIRTEIARSTGRPAGIDRVQRLVDLCREHDADTYISGPAARRYLDEEIFTNSGIEVAWADYSGYPEYAQQHDGDFRHAVTVLDLLANVGVEAAPQYLIDIVAARDAPPSRASGGA